MADQLKADYLAAIARQDWDEVTRLSRELDEATERERARRIRMLDAALWYARQGIPIFPCAERGKRPATGHGFEDATTKPTIIRDWWTWPGDEYNIATPTGLTFDVIDIDGHEGVLSMFAGDRAAYDKLTILGIVKTPRDGGLHLYVPPTGHGNGAKIMPGVDYRGKGGYVLIPPSIGANGCRYHWTRPLCAP